MEVSSTPCLASADIFLPILTSAPARKSSDKFLGLVLNPRTQREARWEQESGARSRQHHVIGCLSCSSSHWESSACLSPPPPSREVSGGPGPAGGRGRDGKQVPFGMQALTPVMRSPGVLATLTNSAQLLPSSARVQSGSIQQHRFLELERAADYF